MDSGLLWSALAKRRGLIEIEPQPRGIPTAVAGNPGHSGSTPAVTTALSLGRNSFWGAGASPHPKRRQVRGVRADTSITLDTANFCRCRGNLAAALQNVW